MLAVVLLSPSVQVRQTSAHLVADNGLVRIDLNRATGDFDLTWGKVAIRNASGAATLADDTVIRTSQYSKHLASTQKVRDHFGTGIQIAVRHTGGSQPELDQTFWLYEGRSEALLQTAVLGTSGARSIVPIETDHIDPIPGRLRTLFVPYDNDAYLHYRGDDGDEPSHEIAARYDDSTRLGLVVGSIDHDVWKTSVQFTSKGLKVIAGAADKSTRDREPHGTVFGKRVSSPRISLGLYTDWRDGMEKYGDLSAIVRPPLPWTGGIPFGWNSWAAFKNKLTNNGVQTATDAIVAMPFLRNRGTASVNLDSYWDNLKPVQLSTFVQRVHAHGLKAGIYWTPFVAWGGLESKVAGDEKRTYGDLALKGSNGQPLPKLDGGYPLDPSHPGTLARIDRQLAEFVRLGFDTVKLDFLTHGALEGRHFDPKLTTGNMAYDRAMRRIADDLSPKRIGRPFFISLSIAPLFPSGFAHSRRISCDVFANIGATEYLMNSANYAWWEAGRLYAFNDPDHTVLYRPLGDQPTTEAEARSRFTASVVAGGMMLDSDNLGDPPALARVRQIFAQTEYLDVARTGRPFRPVDGDVVEGGAEALMRTDGPTTLVAAFNYGKAPKTKTVSLARLGLSGSWTVQDLWTGQQRRATGDLTFQLSPIESALVRLTRMK